MERNPIPTPFSEKLSELYPDHATQILQAMEEEPIAAIHLNNRKPSDLFDSSDRVLWNEFGRYADASIVHGKEPLWHAGAYYSMEPASQVIDHVLRSIRSKIKIQTALDLCAAPGGKSMVVLNALPQSAVLVSNEIHPQRAGVLLENSIKWGRENHMVVQSNATQIAESGLKFDVVLVDAPCSGEGMFRRIEIARSEWSAANVEQCAIRQNEILDEIVEAIHPGGFLVYSTCTFDPSENDLQIERLLETDDWIHFPIALEGPIETKYGLQFAPGVTKSEGLYVAVLQRKGEQPEATFPLGSDSGNGGLDEGFASGIDPDSLYVFGEQQRYIPAQVQGPLNVLKSNKVRVLKAGIGVARKKGKTWVPSHELALWSSYNSAPRLELNDEQAISFLQGDAGRGEAPKGWLLASYKGLSLGWIKGVGNRWNNAYPSKYRMRK